MTDPLEQLSIDLDNTEVENYDIGDIIRQIPVDISYRNGCRDFIAEAFIMADTRHPQLCIKIIDKKTCDEYYMSFNARWMDEEKQNWLASVLCGQVAEIIGQTKGYYKNRLKESASDLISLCGIKL